MQRETLDIAHPAKVASFSPQLLVPVVLTKARPDLLLPRKGKVLASAWDAEEALKRVEAFPPERRQLVDI